MKVAEQFAKARDGKLLNSVPVVQYRAIEGGAGRVEYLERACAELDLEIILRPKRKQKSRE